MPEPEVVIPEDLEQCTLNTNELNHIVTDWLQTHNPSRQQTNYRYKFHLENILPLPEGLMHNFIMYVCFVKFPFLLEDLTAEDKMKKNLFLKQVYQQQFYNGSWKKQFFFQFSMVFMVKTTAKFIAHYFPSLQINENLQSQLYIILHNVLIGNQIGTKIFHIISKKYLKPTIPKPIKSPHTSLTKKDSFITICKPSTKYISEVMHSDSYGNTKHKILNGNKENSNHLYPQNVNPRRNNYRNKISFVKTDSWQRSSLEVFSQQLKKNLYVAPLPVLQPKKMDISDYEQTRYESLESRDKRILGEAFVKPVNLRTTKITSSMDTLMSVNYPNLSSHEQNKPGKILLSRQLNSKHYCLTSCSNHNDRSDKPLAQIFDKDSKSKHNSMKNPGKMSYEEWNQLLGKIRLNSKNSTMFERENPVLGKSFDSINHNQSLNDISYDRTFNKDDSRQLKGKCFKQSFMTRLATEHTPTIQPFPSALRNSDPTQDPSSSQVEQTQYSKLGKYSTTIDTGNQMHYQAQNSEQSLPLFKKQLSSSQQKLSKTSKLKLAKLTFLTECKKREKKLSEAGHGSKGIRMVVF